MTHALNAAEYQPPHVPAGSPSGGQFGLTGGGKAPAKTAPKKTTPKKSAPTARPGAHNNGTLGYDPKTNRGTGYGSPNGDPRVHRLQQALNRLGMTDAAGHPLKLDGKLGPRTTAAVEKARCWPA
jgi:peptidoglycan hydrolase-like protein with peptidoglycan-binding domain